MLSWDRPQSLPRLALFLYDHISHLHDLKNTIAGCLISERISEKPQTYKEPSFFKTLLASLIHSMDHLIYSSWESKLSQFAFLMLYGGSANTNSTDSLFKVLSHSIESPRNNSPFVCLKCNCILSNPSLTRYTLPWPPRPCIFFCPFTFPITPPQECRPDQSKMASSAQTRSHRHIEQNSRP